jgi:hypothetical protein
MHLSHFSRPYFILIYATFARIVECKTLYAIYLIFTKLFTKLYMHFTELHMKILFRHTLYKNPGSATGLTGERSSLRGGKTDGEGGDGVAAVVDGRGWVLFDWVEKSLLMRCVQGIEERASDVDEFLVREGARPRRRRMARGGRQCSPWVVFILIQPTSDSSTSCLLACCWIPRRMPRGIL